MDVGPSIEAGEPPPSMQRLPDSPGPRNQPGLPEPSRPV